MTASTDTSRTTNRLAQETSPYLLQHAHNPVDWYPWGDEAFAKAKAEDKPILLSVGYSACHWCHVMERECFENEQIAESMNRDFVCVKVDREERPDVDTIYMSAVQLFTGQGGWPMTVFLTPDGKPFYCGTYFPPEDHYGRPGFPRVLQAVTEVWQTQRVKFEQQSDYLLGQLNQVNEFSRNLHDSPLAPTILENAFIQLSLQYDYHNGGFGDAPKFPQPSNLDFLLRFHAHSQQQGPLDMVETTLQNMAQGGMYDQLGGGFHRYSTDAVWMVPHFEKMLYDNAQLAQIYARCYQRTGKPFYRGIAEATLEYVLREMTGPEGGFASAQDADSEGEEGKFFVWTMEEVKAALGEQDGAVFCAYYDVRPGGNWEGNNILRVVAEVSEIAEQFGLRPEETAQILERSRARLFAVRETRVKPGLDDKVLTAWNGLMLAAFAECAAVFDRDDFRQAAVKNAHFVLSRLTYRDATDRIRLLRTYRHGESKLNAYLEDYAFLVDGLLWLYQATFDLNWLENARQLTDQMLTYFWDAQNEGFFATSSDHETLIQRPKDWDDNALPSGNSVAIEALMRLSTLTGEESYRQKAVQVLRKLGPALEKHPYSFARMLGALDFYLATPKEIVLVGGPGDEATQALLRTVYAAYLPNKVVALTPEPVSDSSRLPLFADRSQRDGRPTAYVCENYVCKEPTTDPAILAAQLSQIDSQD